MKTLLLTATRKHSSTDAPPAVGAALGDAVPVLEHQGIRIERLTTWFEAT
jgi:hypothetical protein